MNDLPDVLRTAMTEHSDGLMLRPGAAREALDSAASARRTHVALGAGATAVLVGGTAAAVVWLDAQPGSASGRPVSPANSGRATIHQEAHLTWTHPKLLPGADGASPDPALLAVSLPDPAPGFPVRRAEATTSLTSLPNGTYWTDAFLLAAQPATCTTLPAESIPSASPDATPSTQASPDSGSSPSGETSCTPNGAEVTVLVTEGPEPTAPDSDNQIAGDAVIQTVTVDGQTGYVTGSANELDLYYGEGKFAVTVVGEDTTVADLVTLADSLRGLS
jgi:hypothetical protein